MDIAGPYIAAIFSRNILLLPSPIRYCSLGMERISKQLTGKEGINCPQWLIAVMGFAIISGEPLLKLMLDERWVFRVSIAEIHAINSGYPIKDGG